MLVTREADYAVRCVLFLSNTKDITASVRDMSRHVHVPQSFLAKILQRLVKAGIVRSIRGVKGGFRLAKSPAAINLLEILDAIQGPTGINVCAIDRRRCKLSSTCTVHPVWVSIRKDVDMRLRRETIAKLMDNR